MRNHPGCLFYIPTCGVPELCQVSRVHNTPPPPLLHRVHPPRFFPCFLSATCVLKRFLLTSPRKFSLTCVKWGFLRTAEPHRTSQLSPCAPLCRSAISIRCLAVMCHAPAPPHHRLLPRARTLVVPCILTPHLSPCTIPHLIPTHSPSSPYSFSITLPTHFPSLCRLQTGPLQF